MTSKSFLACVAVVVVGCGGSDAAPKTPGSDGTTTTATKPDGAVPVVDAAKPADAAKDAAKPSDKPADAAKPSDKPADPTKPGTAKNLEDVKMAKTTSAGGSYAVNVVSVAGMAGDDVLRSLGMKFDDCYAKLFKKQMAATGKTTFDITISPKGKTASIKLRSDDMKNAELTACIEKIVKAVEWANVTDTKAGAKTTVDWAVAGN